MLESLFDKVTGLKANNFITKETSIKVFFCEYCKIFKNSFFCKTPPAAASAFKPFCIATLRQKGERRSQDLRKHLRWRDLHVICLQDHWLHLGYNYFFNTSIHVMFQVFTRIQIKTIRH